MCKKNCHDYLGPFRSHYSGMVYWWCRLCEFWTAKEPKEFRQP